MQTPSKNLFSSFYPPYLTPSRLLQLLPLITKPMSFGSNPMNQIPDSMVEDSLEFKDFLPFMAERLGPEGLVEELCKGFRLLMDAKKGLITLESLRRNAARLGLEGLADDELLGMLREGDLDGDGALDQMEFCILMFRLSPELMQGSQRMLEEALGMELRSVVF